MKGGNKQKFSPKAYLRQGRARKLPVLECLVPDNWEEEGFFPLIVSRLHSGGTVTFANYLVDLTCVGIKNTVTNVNVLRGEYDEFIAHTTSGPQDFIEIEYNLAHNLVYASIEFAEELDLEPHKEFIEYGQYILEEDDERIPIIDVPLGFEGTGQHLYISTPDGENDAYYKKKLSKFKLGKDYDIID